MKFVMLMFIEHLMRNISEAEKPLENKKLFEMIIPEWLFPETAENKINKTFNPKSLKQIARDNFKLDDKQPNKELAIKMINPYYFTDRNLKVGFKINLDTHHINHSNSILTITSGFPEFGIEFGYISTITKDLSVFYARLKNQYNFKYHTLFSASFCKN